MEIKVSYVCNKGTKRENNEDAVLINGNVLTDSSGELTINPDGGTIFAVADGMGGHEYGEVASKIVLETINSAQITSKEDIHSALIRANENLHNYSETNFISQEMGSAVAGIFIKDSHACVFNIGDCRVYRLRGQYLQQLSRDTSVVGKLIEYGVISHEEASEHPERNVLTSALSSKAENKSLEIILREIELKTEETLLICSDGLWDVLTEDEMEECLTNEEKNKVDFLFKKTIEKGDKDNITIILLEVQI